MRWWIYQALFAVVYVALLPRFLFRMCRRGGDANRFADRFGYYPREVSEKLAELRGMSLKKAEEISAAFRRQTITPRRAFPAIRRR